MALKFSGQRQAILCEDQLEQASDMSYPLPRRKSSTSLRRKQSDSSFTPPTDQTQRELKSAQYKDARYEVLLAAKGSFMSPASVGVMDSSKRLCRDLLEREQTMPDKTLFQDGLFERTTEKVRTRNESRVIQDIGRLIVPSAETLETYGAANLEDLIENVNEGWTNGIPVQGRRPQPDYSVGFRRSRNNSRGSTPSSAASTIPRTSWPHTSHTSPSSRAR